MPKLWFVNQFANTPDLPGHTRQYEVASGLVRKGWRVEVFASDFNLTQRTYRRLRFPFLSACECPAGIHWNWLWVSPYRRNDWKRHLNLFSFCLHLIARLSPYILFGRFIGKSPDIILASSPQLPAAFVCLFLSRLSGIPFVLEVRDLWPQVLIDQGGKSPDSIVVRLFCFMERELYKHSHTVVVLAQGAESYVRSRGASRTIWLPNGPDLEMFSPQSLPTEHSTFNVLYAGAHGDANALENVIEAARLLERRNSPVRFLFVGDGPEKQSLIQLASGLTTVVFNDPVPKTEIPSLMANADAILLSLRDVPLFRYGVSPNKLYDAYAIGRPVITTVAGSINNEVETYGLGVTAAPGDPKALAEAIFNLARTPLEKRMEMAARASNLAQSIYSRRRITEIYSRTLLDAINK